VAVVLSLFLVFLAATLLVGGRTVLDPMLHAAAEVREANRVSAIVFTMPDGAVCRHFSFDNKTAELTEGAVERCARTDLREPRRSSSGFAWGVHQRARRGSQAEIAARALPGPHPATAGPALAFLVQHDLCRKPVSTFRDHALG
jgi:hypothetical protein